MPMEYGLRRYPRHLGLVVLLVGCVFSFGRSWAAEGKQAPLAAQGLTGTRATAVEEPLTLVVDRIQSAEAYARTLHYLSGLGPVAAVGVERVDAIAVVFRLTLRGTREALTRAFAQDKMLAPVTASREGADLHYRLMP